MDQPGALEHMKRALAIIDDCRQRMNSLPGDFGKLGEPNTELHNLIYSELPNPVVDLRLTVHASLTSSLECLEQIKRFCQGVPTTPIVLAALMRTNLLAAARIVFMFGPLAPEQRKTNMLQIVRQESDSVFRWYDEARTYEELGFLVPPEQVLTAQRARKARIDETTTRGGGEAAMLKSAAAITASLLVTRPEMRDDMAVDEAEKALREQLLWIFNVYSGKAHAYGWPRIVPHDRDLPGDFSADFFMLCSMTQLAVKLTEQAHNGTSGGLADTV